MGLMLVVTFKIKEDKTKDFESLVTALSRQVLANEPGARQYQLAKSQTDPQTYRLVEIYADADALAAHGKSAHYQAAAPNFAPCMADKPVLEKFDLID